MITLSIFGIGSPFGDDRLGLEVAALLQQRANLHQFTSQQLKISCCDRPGIYLLELMREAKNVFLIDAIKTDNAIGTIHCFKNDEIAAASAGILSSHGIGIAEAMSLGKALQTLPEEIVLYGINIQDIHYEWHLSPIIAKATEMLLIRIENDILSLLERK